jgi:hypothetical protein
MIDESLIGRRVKYVTFESSEKRVGVIRFVGVDPDSEGWIVVVIEDGGNFIPTSIRCVRAMECDIDATHT